MYVVAKHRIKNAERFLSLAQIAAEQAPPGVYGRQFCPSRDRTEAVCLWEADSVETVRDYLDSLAGEASENAYFQVSTDHAIGIPAPIGVSRKISFETFSGSAAENYERYFVPAIGAPLAEDLVELAALRPGERVLDVACGTGVVARHALERVGDGGRVVGADINAGMLTVARAATPGVGAPDWYEASADNLPLPDGTFDVALCQLGLQFFADKAAAVRELLRVLVPGGRLFVNVPGPTPTLFAELEAALARHVGPDGAGFVRAVFSLHDSVELRELLSGAGFEQVKARSSVVTLRLAAPEDFLWQYVHSTPLGAAVAQLDEEGRAALQREVVAAWQPFTEDGALILQVGMTTASARK
jgi:ubiquinone/menaquinone biosynthesis C-methylase UbiE